MQNYANLLVMQRGKNGIFLVLVIYSGMLEKKPHQDGYLVLGVGFGNLENI